MTLHDDIALRRLGDGRFECEISPDHWLVDSPNGGYVAALLAHAGDRHLDDAERQLRGLTVHYLRPAAAGPAVITASTVQLGRTVAYLRLELTQAGKPVLLATGSWSRRVTGLSHVDVTMPDSRPPADCPPISSVRETGPLPVQQQWDIRSITGIPLGSAERAELAWWIRPLEHHDLDAPTLVAMADALPPPIFMVASPDGTVPTIDLTVHLRADLDAVSWQPGDWVLGRFVTRLAAHGFLEEDGELWSADGTLLAQSRQLALAR